MRIPQTLWAGLILVLLGTAETARGQVFREDFDGSSLDPGIWQTALGDGQAVLSGGKLVLSCSGNTFPVVHTVHDPFPPGDFAVRVGARYVSVAFCGNGFGALDNFYPFFPQGCRPFLAWQDGAGWYSYSGGIGYRYLGTGPDTGYHVYEWRYVNGGYTFLLDGVQLMSETCAPHATAFFIGHPHPVSCQGWTSCSVDFVEIRPLGVTPTHGAAWGQVKARFR